MTDVCVADSRRTNRLQVDASRCTHDGVPAIEVRISGAIDRLLRFVYHRLRQNDGSEVSILTFCRLGPRRPAAWRYAGRAWTPAIAIDKKVGRKQLDEAVRLARLIAPLPEPSAEPKGARLKRAAGEIRSIFAPGDDNTDDFIELVATPDGKVLMREFIHNEWHQLGQNAGYTVSIWSSFKTITESFAQVDELFAADDETAAAILESLFWSDANEKLEDPFLHSHDDDWLADAELTYEQGSEDELQALIRIFFWTEPVGTIGFPFQVRIDSATAEADAKIGPEKYGAVCSERLKRLFSIALAEHKPVGHTAEYNDGANNRRSGFSHDPQVATFEIEAPSAHERLEAFEHLREWLTSRVNPEELRQLAR